MDDEVVADTLSSSLLITITGRLNIKKKKKKLKENTGKDGESRREKICNHSALDLLYIVPFASKHPVPREEQDKLAPEEKGMLYWTTVTDI